METISHSWCLRPEVVPIEDEGHPERRCERREDGGHSQPQVVLEGELHRVRSRRTACLESLVWVWTSKVLDSPGIREDSGNHNEDDECLNPQEVKEFRGLVARANYLAQDRSDIQFATKEACRCRNQRDAAGRN